MTKKSMKQAAIVVASLFLFFIVLESVAHARAGGGRSMGGRGFSSGGTGRSYTGSQPTSPTRQPTQQQPGMAQQRPVQQQPASGLGRGLMYGIGGMLLGGMIGSLLFGGKGHAAGGESGGFGFGDIILILIIVGIVYMVVRYFKRKREEQMVPAAAGYTQYSGAGYDAYNSSSAAVNEGAYPYAQQALPLETSLGHIGQSDPTFNEEQFKEAAQDIFFRIQGAWTRRDLSSVRNLLAPTVLNMFQSEINQQTMNHQINKLENIAVRQVEIVDAAQEHGEEYVTIKFLANLLDYTVDDRSNQIVSGSSADPVKFLEYWTFSRKVGERTWMLSGITQEGEY